MKVSELTGAQLDYWAGKANGYVLTHDIGENYSWVEPETNRWISFKHTYSPSTDWSQGGPIIEREKIMLEHVETWLAHLYGSYEGGTPLIAAMRCFVASKYGEEVPDE